MKATTSMDKLVRIYMDEVGRLHGVLVSIVSKKIHSLSHGFGKILIQPWVLLFL